MDEELRYVIFKLIEKIQFSGKGKRYDTGDHERVCLVCKEQVHHIDCPLLHLMELCKNG